MSDLTPSQAIRTTNTKSAGNNTNTANRTNNRRRNRTRGPKVTDSETANNASDASAHTSNQTAAIPPTDGPVTETATLKQPPSAAKAKTRNRRKKANNSAAAGQKTQSAGVEEAKPEASAPTKSKPRTNRQRNKTNYKKYPWKQHIPEDAVDPITLDSLRSLHYPPFSLVATTPYDPVPEWPIPDVKQEESIHQAAESEEDRQRRVLAEQWGAAALGLTDVAKPRADEKALVDDKQRHYHLYDGRALAYYMVSQLQFIDPLNRRDLVRDELVNLDRYLRRHGFTDLNVTEAYDAKGVTISTAGAAGNTAAGRAAILQQEASQLLGALFGRTSLAPSRPFAPSNALMQQYRAHEAAQQESNRQPARLPDTEPREDIGIYGDVNGLSVIDDDLNPGLRGNAPAFVPMESSAGPNTLWSSSHITGRYNSHTSRAREHDFPSLANTNRPRQPAVAPAPPKKVLPPAKTLSAIGKLVKKTSPEEQQRQFEAREEARRKALLTNLTFGSNPALAPSATTLQSQIATPAVNVPTEGQLDRNRAFAQALGVQPATIRSSYTTGWARPVFSNNSKVGTDDFGTELNATAYPDKLILEARERMGALLKLEKKWKVFLQDDTAASLPLNPMDKPLRIFVHEYSDFWKLHTESFDPEPKRYIHCVKLLDTSSPYPLLSDAARNWRGPRASLPSGPASEEHPLQQTSGQNTTGPERLADFRDGVPVDGGGRFASLAPETGERPKLELQKRSLPTKLPPMVAPSKGFIILEELQKQKSRAEEDARKSRKEDERKERLLAAAFASDDEEDGGAADDDSSWEEQEAVYTGEEEEAAAMV